MDILSYSAREPSTPLRFGRYEVLFRIAAGGMAEVYAARMVGEGGFEKPVAVKRMLPTLAEDERFVQMFLDEGRLAAHIASPHVVQTLDLGRAEDDSLYLVMELVVGVSLSALIRAVLKTRTPFPVPVAVDILAQAAEGLHDAHEAKTMYGQPLEIVHRDISPQNILVDVAGRVRITDFGVARALERATHTQSGEVKGKIGYFAPEQVRGKNIDRRTDVYALGIVAWETLAGRRLFAGDNPAQTLDMVMNMTVPRLDALRSDVPRALADAVAHALQRDIERRTASAGDFADELRRAARGAGSSGVGELVRAHGGEALMKLEEGLRAQSPSSASRVRRAMGGTSPGATQAATTARASNAIATSGRTASSAGAVHAPAPPVPVDLVVLDEEPTSQGSARGLTGLASEDAPTRERPTVPSPAQVPTQLHSLPDSVPSPHGPSPYASARLGAPDPFALPSPVAQQPPPSAASSSRWMVAAVGGLAVLLLAAALVGWWASGDPSPTPTVVATPLSPTPIPAATVTTATPTLEAAPPAAPPDPAAGAAGAGVADTSPAVPMTAPETPRGVAGRRSTPPRRDESPRLADPRGTRPASVPTTVAAPPPPPEVRPEPRSEPRPRGLVGVSDFERELGGD
ncbi:MAG: hypothetical protein OHK0013_12980 [Sandaracinaceae bacterium]